MPVLRYPFLRPELSRIEGMSHMQLSCWLHALRDALYAAGHLETQKFFLQPLDLGIEHPFGVLSIFGGLDSHYYAPSFSRGLSARWIRPNSVENALDLLSDSLEAGKAVPVSLDFSVMRHSRYFRVGTFGIPHTALLFGLEKTGAWIADPHTRAEAHFSNYHGLIAPHELAKGLLKSNLLIWDCKSSDAEIETRDLLIRSLSNLTKAQEDPVFKYLFKFVEDFSSNRSRDIRIRQYLGYNILRRLASDRHFFAEMVKKRPDSGAYSVAIEQIRSAADAWSDLGHTLLIFSNHWCEQVSDRFRKQVSTCESHESSLHGSLVLVTSKAKPSNHSVVANV